MEQLPPELLPQIFTSLKNFGYRYALPALSVCKAWNRIGTHTIYKSLHLQSYDVVPFAGKFRRGYKLITNLTITWQNVFDNRCDCPNQLEQPSYVSGRCDPKQHVRRRCKGEEACSNWRYSRGKLYLRPGEKDVTRLMALLRHALPQLTTFSLTIDNEPESGPWCACRTNEISSSFLARVVWSLPSTCVNLEIDSRGADYHATEWEGANLSLDNEPPPWNHVCAVVAATLPRLHSLRLRLGCICPNFFVHLPGQSSFSLATLPYLAGSACQRWGHAQNSEMDFRWEHLQELGIVDLTSDQKIHKKWWELDPETKQHSVQIYSSEQLQEPDFSVTHCPHLEQLVVNLCPFPHSSSTWMERTGWEESGLVAATAIAATLQRAYRAWNMFPSLESCKVVCSDFQENYETHCMTDSFDSHGPTTLSYGAISHLILYDIVGNCTTVVPFRSPAKLRDITGQRMRETMIHEWRDEDDLPHHSPLEQAEPFFEQAWLRMADGTRTPKPRDFWSKRSLQKRYLDLVPTSAPIYQQYHTQEYDGLLDRSGITEKWFEDGILHLYSHFGTCNSPYGRYEDLMEKEIRRREEDRQARLESSNRGVLDAGLPPAATAGTEQPRLDDRIEGARHDGNYIYSEDESDDEFMPEEICMDHDLNWEHWTDDF